MFPVVAPQLCLASHHTHGLLLSDGWEQENDHTELQVHRSSLKSYLGCLINGIYMVFSGITSNGIDH